MTDWENSRSDWPSYEAEIAISINYGTGKVEQRRSDTYLTECLNDADISRLRECPFCSRLYLVKRKDKKFCTDRCRNSFGARARRREDKKRRQEEREEAAKSGRTFNRRRAAKKP